MAKIFFRLVLGALAGKVLGLGREALLAALFGAGRVVAANRIALTATLIPVTFFTADALSAGFLPLYVQYRQQSPAMALTLYRCVRFLLSTVSLVLMVSLLLGRDLWVDLLGPGLDHDTSAMAATMLGIAAFGVPFYIQFNLYALVALAHEDVHLINIRASLQSIGLICATIVAFMSGDVSVLAWGFTVPYVLLCGWGFWWMRRQSYLQKGCAWASVLRLPVGYKKVLGMFWLRLRPLLIIPVVLQGSIAVERAVASLLGVEVVAAAEYSRFVVDSSMALLAAPLGLAGLASFSKMGADEVAHGLRRLVPVVVLVTVPLTLALCINSRGIVAMLYGRGRFDESAIDTSSIILQGFALGIWAQVLGYMFVKVLNARGTNLKVTVVMMLSCSVAMGLNLLLYPHWGAFTLGASASVGGIVMFLASARSLKVLRFSMGLLRRSLPGAVAATVVGYWLSGHGLLRLLASCAAIVVVWAFYVAMVPGLRRAFLSSIWRRMRRAAESAEHRTAASASVDRETVSAVTGNQARGGGAADWFLESKPDRVVSTQNDQCCQDSRRTTVEPRSFNYYRRGPL